jgi:hypothetical protein
MIIKTGKTIANSISALPVRDASNRLIMRMRLMALSPWPTECPGGVAIRQSGVVDEIADFV